MNPISWRTRAIVPLVLLASIVAACGASAGTASPLSDPTPSFTPAPTDAPTSVPTPSPTPTPTAGRTPFSGIERDALDAFAELITRDDLAYHVTQVASISVAETPLAQLTYELDVSGKEFRGRMTSGEITIDVVYVDGKAHTRVGHDPWTVGSLDEATVNEAVNPWRYLGAIRDLDFKGKDPIGGLLYEGSRAVPYQTANMKANGLLGTIDELELLLVSDGTPVSMVLRGYVDAPATGPLAGRKIDLVTTFDFSEFGEPIVIKVPK